MKKRDMSLKKYGISGKRYKELCGFCEQYPEWQEELKEVLSVKGKVITGMPTAKGRTTNTTEELAIKRQQLLQKCKLIEKTAIEADEELYAYIIKNVCYELPCSYLKHMGMPCSSQTFYDKRRYFFYLLDQNKKK